MLDIVDKPKRVQKGSITLDTGEEIPYFEPLGFSPRQQAVKMADKLHDKGNTLSYLTFEGAYQKKQSLTPCAKDMLDYMCMHMDRDNCITMSAHQRRKFCFQSQTTDGTPRYQESTAYKALRELRKTDLLREVSEVCYIVNPKYFFNSSSAIRHRQALTYQLAYEQLLEDKPD